jgi:hypothetical protein
MKEIDKSYFLEISKLVNADLYNAASINVYNKVLYIDNMRDEDTHSMLKSKLVDDGFAIVEINKVLKNSPDTIGLWLESLFGEPPLDKNPGQLSYAKVQAEENATHYVNSNVAQPIHTDEGHTNQYPRFAALYCFKQAALGGYSITVPFKPLYKQLRGHFGKLVDILFMNDSVTVRNSLGDQRKSILLKLENGDVGISYSPVLQKMWCSDQVFQLFDFITIYVHNPTNQIRLKLKENQVLLLDNCRALHGRTAFPKNDGRLLYRYWFGNRIL